MFWFVAMIIVILLFLLLIIPINISLEYIRKKEEGRATLTISILRRLINIKIPFNDIYKKQGLWGLKFLKRKKGTQEREFPANLKEVKKNINQFLSDYPIYRQTLYSTKDYLRKKVVCSNLVFKMDMGLDDAALTGIATGFVWGIVYNILSILSGFVNIKKTDIKIQPIFNEMVLGVDFYCIFTFRVVHIIIGFLILIFSFIKAIWTEKIFPGLFRFNRNNVKA